MTREQSKRIREEFNRAMATELEAHLNNGSAFIFEDELGQPEVDDVVKLRVQILKGVVRTLRFRGGRR